MAKCRIKQFSVQTRKIPLLEIRKESLRRNHNLMRSFDERHYDEMTWQQVECQLEKINEPTSSDLDLTSAPLAFQA